MKQDVNAYVDICSDYSNDETGVLRIADYPLLVIHLSVRVGWVHNHP